MIDLDPQANLSLSLGIKTPVKTIYGALIGSYAISDVVIPVQKKLDVIPSTLDLSGAELELASETGRELIMKDLLEPIKDNYDYILIDCPLLWDYLR